jgi:GTPase SAR1 family protein
MDYSVIVSALISSLFSGGIAWKAAKSDIGQKNSLFAEQLRDSSQKIDRLTSELNTTKRKVSSLSDFEKRYREVRKKLQASSVVREYIQPVILVGPRAVGKTSLLTQWHAPWDHSRLQATQTHKISTVPIYDFNRDNTEPHFADPDILTDVHVHLKLRVHDFPGELSYQANIIDQTIQETIDLRKSTGKNLGIILICLFDAEEVDKGLSQTTIDYYNGELFSNLRELVNYKEIKIERLIIVFNKYDLLKKNHSDKDDKILLELCLKTFKPLISSFRGFCNPERVCEIFTTLGREDMSLNNRGSSTVMSESARKFVETMAGFEAAQEVIKEKATTYAAPMFS